MAPTQRYSNRDEAEDRPRRRAPAKKGGPPMAPILALCVLIAGAIGLARFAARNKKPAAEPPKIDASTVYGDLREEAPPVPGQGRGRASLVDKAPPGLMEQAIWKEALDVAARAAEVFTEAKKAKAANDHGEWNKLGNEAQSLYNEAVEMTAEWEAELLDKYGDNDRQVDAIARARNKWIDVLITLHKTTGRG